MAHRRTFVDHLDPGIVERRQDLRRIVPRCLDHLDPTVDDRLDHPGIVGRIDDRQEGKVHAERLVGHVATPCDLVRKIGRRFLRQPGDDPEATCIRNRCRHFGKTDKMHAALDDRMFDAEHLGDACLHGRILFGAYLGSTVPMAYVNVKWFDMSQAVPECRQTPQSSQR